MKTTFHGYYIDEISLFWIKMPCSIPGDFDPNFQLAQSISVFMFQYFYYYACLQLATKKEKHLNMKTEKTLLTNWKVLSGHPQGWKNTISVKYFKFEFIYVTVVLHILVLVTTYTYAKCNFCISESFSQARGTEKCSGLISDFSIWNHI